MKTVDIGDISVKVPEIRSCAHRAEVQVFYVNNDGMTAPVLLVEGCRYQTVITLTNQVIRASCPVCFEKIRQSLETPRG